MSRKRYTPEQIISMLREAEVALAQPFIKPLEDGRIVGFLKQKPAIGGEMAVRLLVDHLDGKEITSRFSYNPDVVTSFNLEQFR